LDRARRSAHAINSASSVVSGFNRTATASPTNARTARQQIADRHVGERRGVHRGATLPQSRRLTVYWCAVTESCTVFISAPGVLPTLQRRAGAPSGEMITFSDADALRALDVITKRRPGLVVLERLFAATPRGAALINRIKADPTLEQAEIRVLSHDSDYARVLSRPTQGGNGATMTIAEPASRAVTVPVAPLDQRGTRRAPRFRIAGQVDVLIDGNTAALVDLSTCGAHVISPTILKPNQRVRMALPDDVAVMKFNAAVAWASFEIPPKSGPRYRAGINFVDADGPLVAAFCGRHRA